MKVHGLILLFILSSSEASYQYEFHFEDEKVFTPCPKYPNNFLDKHFDISDLSFNAVGEGKVHIKGKVISLVDWKNFKIRVDIYKKVRGTWQPSVYSIERQDLCNFIADPNDLVFSFWQHLPELHCPFIAGNEYNLDYIADVGFSFVDGNLEGYYRGYIKIINNEDNQDFACIITDIYSYRI